MDRREAWRTGLSEPQSLCDFQAYMDYKRIALLAAVLVAYVVLGELIADRLPKCASSSILTFLAFAPTLAILPLFKVRIRVYAVVLSFAIVGLLRLLICLYN